jgi:hypothetical protein
MKKWVFLLFLPLALVASPSDQYELSIPLIERPLSEAHARSRAVSMAELSQLQRKGVSAVAVSDYVYGNYRGDFSSPSHADLNPRRVFIIQWEHFPFQFVFSHEASYCPWFEFQSGSGVSFQFFEGNLGWAELMNQWGSAGLTCCKSQCESRAACSRGFGSLFHATL